jgi:hypothetical protein
MIESDEFQDDTTDPELAFVRLEAKFRAILKRNVAGLEQGDSGPTFYIEYINHTLAAAEAFGVDILEHHTVPEYTSDKIYANYHSMILAVDRFRVKLEIAHAHDLVANEVTFTGSEKESLKLVIDLLQRVEQYQSGHK